MIAKEETLNKSLFYNPIQEVSKYIYPSEKWYAEFKETKKSA
jgi:membrane protein required for colicin V production